MVYYLGEELIETTEDEAFETGQSAVFIVNEDECPRILPKLGISYEREYKLEDVYSYSQAQRHNGKPLPAYVLYYT